MTECKPAVFVSGLKKSFRGKEVLKGVSFSVPHGSIYALLGSNGAGKTTTIRILTTQIKADAGIVEIAGYDAAKDPEKVRGAVSLTGQSAAVDETLTGKENLVIMGKLRQIADPEKKARELLEYFELSSSADRFVSTYSGGMKRKLDIAMSLAGTPRVLFLDEPTTGLDPQSRHAMWNIIRGLSRTGVTVFLTTQYLEEAEELADMIVILDQGAVAAEGTPAELKACLPRGIVHFLFKDAENFRKAEQLLRDYKISVVPEEWKIAVYTDGDAGILAEIFRGLHEKGVEIREFSTYSPNLEDAFLSIIRRRRK